MPHPPVTSDQQTFLQHFFQEVERRLPANQTLAATLEHLLGLSKSNIYKRLRGEIALPVAELLLLAKTYHISVDEWLFRETGQVAMHFMPLAQPVRKPVDFLQMNQHLLKEAGKMPNLVIHYATAEMAGFQYLVFPELTAFKMHMWNRTTWDIVEYNQPKFSPDLYTQDTELQTACLDFWKLWNQTPTTEYWQTHMLENTLSQLRFSAYEGSFEQPETAALICEQILELIEIWEKMADTGLKPPGKDEHGLDLAPVPFKLYHNEIFHTNNVFLLESPARSRVVLTFSNPNTLTTEEAEFCAYTATFFAKIRAHSQRLSEEGEKQRRRFFRALRSKAAVAKKEIKTLLH